MEIKGIVFAAYSIAHSRIKLLAFFVILSISFSYSFSFVMRNSPSLLLPSYSMPG